MKTIPTKINKYNVYNAGNRLLGMGDEVTLPSFEGSSETVSGAGVLGKFDDPTVGYFGNMELEIPFRVLDEESVDMLDQTKVVQLELRGAQQTMDENGDIEFRPMRVVVRGRMAGFEPGKVKAGNGIETSVKLTILYILIELEDQPMVELGKTTETFKIRGVDVLAVLILMVITNIIVQVVKKLTWDKVPTNLLAFIVVMAVTMLVFFAVCQIKGVPIAWYMVATAVALGFFVAFAAMFGFDKFRQMLEQITHLEDRKE